MVKLIFWTAAIVGLLYIFPGDWVRPSQAGKHAASRAQITNWPYMQVDIPLDPWGAPYDYRIIDSRPRITYRAAKR